MRPESGGNRRVEPSYMKHYKITLRNGNSFKTGMNASYKEAAAYYKDFIHVEESEDGKETKTGVERVELINY
jgi:hypothetical protein